MIWQRAAAASENRVESVATRLKSLMYLPAEKWNIHSGDIPHGEAVDLDDSSWKIVGPNSSGSV